MRLPNLSRKACHCLWLSPFTATAVLRLSQKRRRLQYCSKAAGVSKGSSNPNTDKVGKITREQLAEIAKMKQADLTAATMDAAIRTIAGSARSMGLEVEGV